MFRTSLPALGPTLALLLLGAATQEDPQSALGARFAEAGVTLDLGAGTCAFPAEVIVRDDYLEYLLVAPHGAVHEALFGTGVDVEILNAALLALGAKPGSNAMWAAKDPEPTPEERAAGVSPYDVTLPSGDGFYLYLAWREGTETFFYRAEDLVRDVSRGRTLERHRWVFLGSRMVERAQGEAPVFAAASEGNLINVAFFSQGNTLLTAAVESCVQQDLWLPNAWLLPASGSPLLFVAARERLAALPEALASKLPEASTGSGTPR